MKSNLPKPIKFLLLVVLVLPLLVAFNPQESKVKQRKIEREQKRKSKQAEKFYRQAKKDHEKRQSKETKAMMKKSRKESKKNTPMKPPGGKKCK